MAQQNFKVLIFSDYKNSSRKQIAYALYQNLMQNEIDVQLDELGSDFTWLIGKSRIVRYWIFLKSLIKRLIGYKLNLYINLLQYKNIKSKIKCFDVLIICSHLPDSFFSYNSIIQIRKLTRAKIYNYDLHYYLNMIDHVEYLKAFKVDFDEIYDGYLFVGAVSPWGLSKSSTAPSYQVGLSLSNNLNFNFIPNIKRKFSVVLDFLRGDIDAYYIEIQNVQKKILEKLQIPYISLKGQYEINELRKIYQNSVIFFTCAHESFCLPVIENQLLGNKIVAPTEKWLQAHMLKDLYSDGLGPLGSNFIVYNFDYHRLEQLLLQEREKFENDPSLYSYNCVGQFKLEYPFFNDFNVLEINRFLSDNA